MLLRRKEVSVMGLGFTTRVRVNKAHLTQTLVRGGVKLVSGTLERTVTFAKALAPKDTGYLHNQTRWRITHVTAGSVSGVAQSHTTYAYFVNTGTGIYGPRGRPIVPVRAKVLRFPARGGRRGRGGFVHARSVKGSPANPYLVRGLRAATAGGGWKVTTLPV